ncbi:outer membrane beta-barrel protein [Telmatospirillum sp.]|uniref:outer membrane protein n=1 Tax=Telmatospirillum sp. TaxID=2079197 RepID=UPI00284E0985|nr:outer membrane beta-barrel protein [Telmatospirillum sp.]MDR3436565.1 outer membrane beta-barrel protein [Telmatospirillum sp.]
MRLTVLAVAAAALSLPAVASAGNFDGIYGGAQIGGAFTSLEKTNTSPIYSGGGDKNDSLSANGVVGGVFAGYGYVLPYNIFVAAEIDATFGGRDYSETISDPTNPYQSKIKTGTEWGMSFRPGYVINEHALVYGLFGFERTPLKSTSTASEVTFDKTQTAFRLGLGTEISIYGPLTFRADYVHTFLDDITFGDSFGTSTTIKPSEDKFKLGVAYHF